MFWKGGKLVPRPFGLQQENSTQEARKVESISGWKLLAMLPLAIVARLWTLTLRLQPSPAMRELLARDQPQVFLLWHNRLFIIAEIYRRYRRPHANRHMHGLISASKDGAWLAAFFRLVGIRAVRGSSSWRGAQAMREVLRVVEDGGDIGITPDGPRGPCYVFQPGAVLVARKAGIPVIVFGMRFTRGKRLKSWDGFYLPRPFSRIEVDAIEYVSEPNEQAKDSVTRLQRELARLNPDSLPHPRDEATPSGP